MIRMIDLKYNQKQIFKYKTILNNNIQNEINK